MSRNDASLDLKRPEWEMFCHPEAQGDSPDLRLRAAAAPSGFEAVLERVVLVERMCEVRAMAGFTRLDAPGELGDDPNGMARRMSISRRKPLWVPAAEVRGEGIFLQFKEIAIQARLSRPSAQSWDDALTKSHTAWRRPASSPTRRPRIRACASSSSTRWRKR